MSKVKQVTFLKTTFYKNMSGDGGAQAEAIKNIKAGEICIFSETKKMGRLWGSCMPLDLIRLTTKNHNMYEILHTYPKKVYFDIEKHELLDSSYLEKMKSIIIKHFPNAKMAVSGSYHEKKTSFHIILQNYLIQTYDELKLVQLKVKTMKEKEDEGFDIKVYERNKLMKCINQSKRDDDRIQAIIEDDNVRHHFISCFFDCTETLPLPINTEEVRDEVLLVKSKQKFDLATLPKVEVQKLSPDFDVLNASAEELLNICPCTKEHDFSYLHLIARFCYHNGLTFDRYLQWLQNRDSKIRKNEEGLKSWNKLNKFPTVERGQLLAVLSKYYKDIHKDIHYRRFIATFDLPTENTQLIETIDQTCFNVDKRVLVFNVGMGGGKTIQTIDYLEKQESFIWIAPNISLANNTFNRFPSKNLTHYRSVTPEQKKTGKMQEINRLMICLNSLHYIGNRRYDVLVIDEIETVIDKFLGDFIEGNNMYKLTIWNAFVNLFRNCSKIILLDAFITKKTLNLVSRIIGSLDDVVIFKRRAEPQTRTIEYVTDEKALLKDAIDKLNAGNKIFMFYPYKQQKGSSKIIYHAMQTIKETLEKETGKKGQFYNAESPDDVKDDLKNVNESWAGLDFVITNNIVTCGVNYDEKDFDYSYLLIASHNTPRDIIQVSYRCRYLDSGIIRVCYMGCMTQTTSWLNDCTRMNCPLYTETYRDILVEQQAPTRRSFEHFCKKANYKQIQSELQIDTETSKELDELLEKNQVYTGYMNIKDLSFEEKEEVEDRVICQQATVDDKYQITKYYFKHKFVEDADVNVLADLWDNKYTMFVKRMQKVLTDKNNIFNKIAEHNSFDKLFPTDVKDTKLSDELKDRIFTEFTFKHITRGSSVNKICKEIYNTYFGREIIEIAYDSNKHASYSIAEENFKYYDFCKDNLILNSNGCTLNSMSSDKTVFV